MEEMTTPLKVQGKEEEKKKLAGGQKKAESWTGEKNRSGRRKENRRRLACKLL